MMLMADGSHNIWSGGDGGFEISDEDFNMSIDLDSFYSILGEDAYPQQFSPGGGSFQNVIQGASTSFEGNQDNILLTKGMKEVESAPALGTYLPASVTQNSSISSNLNVSDFRRCGSDSIFQSNGNHNYEKMELSAQISALSEMLQLETNNEIPDCSSSPFGFAAGDVNHVTELADNVDLRTGGMNSKYTSYSLDVEKLETKEGQYGVLNANSRESLGLPEDNSSTSREILYSEANASHVSDNICSDFLPASQYSMGMDDVAFPELFDLPYFHCLPKDETPIKEEYKFAAENACFNSNITLDYQFEGSARHGPHVSAMDYHNSNGSRYEFSNYMSPTFNDFFSKGSVEVSTQAQSYTACEMQDPRVKEEGSNELVTHQNSAEFMGNQNFLGAANSFFTDTDEKQSFPAHLPQIASIKHPTYVEDEKKSILFPTKKAFHSEVIIDETVNKYPINGGCMALKESTSIKQNLGYNKNENENKRSYPRSMACNLSTYNSIQSNSFGKAIHAEDDNDICILEDISMPPRSNTSSVLGKSLVVSQNSTLLDPINRSGDVALRHKPNDERDIFRVALQDLSQPKSECSPPEGLLAVPLLRHQKIALSWMVQKETNSLCCSGGILADDQGLGKTISTIALILKERSPPAAIQKCIEQCELETFNLEDDDYLGHDRSKNRDSSIQSRGRPAAGTLVVCPTSVLRQWAEELHNKVTEKANLSVLVYHGSHRTKDPIELAKYDVVITTYSIVSLEVPKQPLVDKEDDEKKKEEALEAQSMGYASSKKRKYPPSSSKKNKKGTDDDSGRALSKVGWFRVVLDEAQSIKNHRTQVARACWGLRSKRRWCLSGTPIQNAIDDLYSYFRFLRYDPYAVYKSFCSTIKVPINKNPTNGYRKLQAVLKTIMLRRTKGTLLDGEPIINLPPKTIELKRVDFSKEERDFYSRLEAYSRAQFEEYAAAGTLKQNYVNILLMLLQLRQACNHPHLVKTNNSKSIQKSSVETAKKVPHDKRNSLLTCLEASLAICGICTDPPEDAVVSICGHVFCHQCICEHLVGDDNHCPSKDCKVQLNVLSVFSKETLKCSLDTPISSNCQLVEAPEPCSQEPPPNNSSKLKAALEYLQSISIKVEGEKAIVFSQWTGMLNLFESSLKSCCIQYRRLDGTMSILSRDKAVKEFNTRPEVSVMIMSLKAASLGLNMVSANHVVMLDVWWNPTTEDQAIDRAHRIGQTRPVTVLRLTVKDTVEDRILALQQRKREMVASAFGEDKSGSCETRLTVEDLKYLFMV